MLPASTTAMITSFLPAFSAANGFGLRGGGPAFVASVGRRLGNIHAKIFWKVVGGGGGGTAATGGTGAEGGVLLAVLVGKTRLRGFGGGTSGDTSNRSVSSRRVGIGVVRALVESQQKASVRNRWAYLITTIWKSGAGGAVLRNGVGGL